MAKSSPVNFVNSSITALPNTIRHTPSAISLGTKLSVCSLIDVAA
jgi:hypothetical protein